MRFWAQLKLVLWKNFTLRKRQHLRNLIELFWPLLLFLILVGVRTRRRPEHRSNLSYKPRALPSAGLVMFMQSLFCDFKNSELDPDKSYLVSNGLPNVSNSGLLRLFQDAGPLLLNGSFRNRLLQLNPDYQKWIQDNQAMNKLLRGNASSWANTNLSAVPFDRLLKDPAEFRQFLLNTTKLDPKLVGELMNSRVDVQKVTDIFQPIGLGSSSQALDISKLLSSANPQQLIWMMWLLRNLDTLRQNGWNLNGVEIRQLFCYVGSPVSVQHILISPNNQSLDGVDKALCNLSNPDLVKLVREVQTQLVWPNATDLPNQVNSTTYTQLQKALSEDLENLSLDLQALRDLDRAAGDYIAMQSQLRGGKGLHKALCDQLAVAKEDGSQVSLQKLGAGAISEVINRNNEKGDEDEEAKTDEEKETPCPQVIREHYGEYRELLLNKSLNTDTCSVIEPEHRIDCGWPHVTKSQCLQMGCCFDDTVPKTRFCFFEVENVECNCLLHELIRRVGGVSGNPGKGRADRGFVQLSSLFIRGKILFAPDNAVTRRIVSEIKTQFSDVQRIGGFAEWWLNNSARIQTVLNYANDSTNQGNAMNLQRIWYIFNQLPDLRNRSDNGVLDLVKDVDKSSASYITNSTNVLANVSMLLESLNSTFQQLSQLQKCTNHDYFEGYPDEKSLENRAVNSSAAPVIASLVFENVKHSSTVLPKFVKYKIRQDIDYTPRTDGIRDRYWRPGPRDGFSHNRYMNFGFMFLQDLVDRALMNVILNETVLEPGIYMQELPYPCYINDRFSWYLSAMLPLFMTLAWVFSVAMIVKGIVYEKEKRLKEVMKVMGMSTSVHWLAWFINSCVPMIISVLMLTVLLKWGQLLQYSDPVIIIMFLLVFTIATVMMCFLISVFFARANLAAACGGIIFFVSYLPYVLVRWFEMFMNTSEKAVASLSSTTAFGIACSYFSRLEEQGIGAQWSNLYSSPVSDDGFSLGYALGMMMIDAVIYALLTWYIEAVMPGQYGIPRPWYFPFLKSYWFENASSTGAPSHVHYSRAGHVDLQAGSSHRVESPGLDEVFFSRDATQAQALAIEKEPVHLPLGVSVQNLVKIYKQGNKLAVDGLSLNLYENQITSFLGHNGAGKTTTMSVLSGLFPPTSGTAIINGHDIRTDIDLIRRSLGICPQYNVLFDGLSVQEHLYFYASLKGMAKEKIPEEIENFLNNVGLVNKRHELVCHLSGGMKRKLSVAMAFVADSKVVILDEPTAGVDPYARRGIWDLLLQYKTGRTILLSTHHMDEADVLGDRIAIISHGKLQCCGTSLFLKSHYGNGYYVTLTKKAPEERPLTARSLREVTLKVKDPSDGSQASSFDEGVGLDSIDPSERGSIESLPLEPSSHPGFQDTEMHCNEATVTSFIKSYIPCAQLVEHIGSELTYVLPTEAAREGRFQDLFEELDKSLGKLHIGTYGVSDTTLEEVFLKVAADANAEEEDQMAAEVPKRRRSFRGRMQFRRMRIGNNLSDTAELLEESNEDTGDEGDAQVDGSRRCGGADFDVDQRLVGLLLLKQQFWALLVKRFCHSRRNRKAFLSQILLPAVFVCLAMIVSQIRPFSEMPAIELSTDMFIDNEPHENHVFFSVDDPRSADAKSMANMLLKYPGIGTHCLDDKSCWRNLRIKFNKQRPMYENSSVDCDCSKGTSICPAGAGGPSPPEWTSHTQDIVQDLTGRDVNDYLSKTYKTFVKKRYGGVSFGNNLKNLPRYYTQTNSESIKRLVTEHNAKAWYNNKGYHAMPTFLNVLNNAILRSKAQAKGWNASEFGIRIVNHPMIYNKEQLNSDTLYNKVVDVMVSICVVFAMCFVPSSFVVYLVSERVNKAKHLHLVSGVRPYIYWLANYVWDMGNYIIAAVCCCLIFLAFGVDSYTSAANFPPCFLLLLLYGWAITPLMYPASYLFEVPSTAYIVLICANLFVGINATLSTFILEFFQDDEDLVAINDVLKKIFLIFPNYCLGRGLIDLAKNQFMLLFSRFGENLFRDPFSWDITGRNIVALVIEGFVFFIITVLIEYKFFIRPRRVNVSQTPNLDEDDDVQQERTRVGRGDGRITDALCLENLTKVYNSRKVENVAVNRLCVRVPKGECFGLLGVNGAGKTTTFKMLTGDIPVTSGGAYVMGNSILTSIHDVHQAMGYCPQFDGLDDMLTAREHLRLYARLRGVPECDITYVVDALIRKMNLVQYQDRSAGGYSGGNKRKLSTAIALVGNPPVVLLDEPTTGMDPKARRFLWDIITSIVKEGRTVILTSHSMEECEALCSRVAIMVNGQFKCLGSPQHLKNKYGDGYTVTMRVAGTIANLDAVCEFMQSLFPGAVLKDRHNNSLEFQLMSRGLLLSSVFGHMEANRKIFGIEDYSVTQTTLDQVFINFAKNQKDAMDRDVTSGQTPSDDQDDTTGNYVRMVDIPLGEISV